MLYTLANKTCQGKTCQEKLCRAMCTGLNNKDSIPGYLSTFVLNLATTKYWHDLLTCRYSNIEKY